MGRRTYSTMDCPYGCGRSISQSGQAKVAHYRRHVREGFLTEHRAADWSLYFKRTGKRFPPHAEGCQCLPCRLRRRKEEGRGNKLNAFR